MDYSSPPFNTLWAWIQTCWLLHQLLCHIHVRIHTYVHAKECPFCMEVQYSPSRKSYRIFSYLPLIPWLQAFFQNAQAVELLLYHHWHLPTPSNVSDVFNGEWYCILCSMLVTIDGIPYSHHYFDHQYDIALGVTADSYLLFKHRHWGPSATPILIQNLNLPL